MNTELRQPPTPTATYHPCIGSAQSCCRVCSASTCPPHPPVVAPRAGAPLFFFPMCPQHTAKCLAGGRRQEPTKSLLPEEEPLSEHSPRGLVQSRAQPQGPLLPASGSLHTIHTIQAQCRHPGPTLNHSPAATTSTRVSLVPDSHTVGEAWKKWGILISLLRRLWQEGRVWVMQWAAGPRLRPVTREVLLPEGLRSAHKPDPSPAWCPGLPVHLREGAEGGESPSMGTAPGLVGGGGPEDPEARLSERRRGRTWGNDFPSDSLSVLITK